MIINFKSAATNFIHTVILMLMFIGSSHGVKAQIVDDSTLQWVNYLQPKDTFVYQVTQKKLKIMGVDTSTTQHYTYDLTLVVLDTAGSKIKIKAEYNHYESKLKDALLEEVLKSGEGTVVEYTTNNFGVFEGISNADQVIKKVKQSYKSLEKKFADKPEIQQVLKSMLNRYATKEGIEAGGIDEIQFLHTGIGFQYVLYKDYEEDIHMPSISGGVPFDGVRTFRLLEIDSLEKTAMLKIITDIDGAQFRNETIEVLKSMLPLDKQKSFNAEEVPEMFVQNRLVNLFHYDYGWNLYSYNIKEVEAGGNISQEITEISLK